MILSEHTWQALLDPKQTARHIRDYAHWVQHQSQVEAHVYLTLSKLNQLSLQEQLNWYPIWDRIYYIPQQYHLHRWYKVHQHNQTGGWQTSELKHRQPQVSRRL